MGAAAAPRRIEDFELFEQKFVIAEVTPGLSAHQTKDDNLFLFHSQARSRHRGCRWDGEARPLQPDGFADAGLPGERLCRAPVVRCRKDEVDERDNIIALKSVGQELSEAIEIAEKAASGKAISGGLVKERDQVNFVVLVLSEDRVKEVFLDPPRAASTNERASSRKNGGQ